MNMHDETNPCGLRGIAFIEFASPDPDRLHRLFLAFGFSHLKRHVTQAIDYYRQGDIHLFINREPSTFAADFAALHGPSICSMGWRFDTPGQAFEVATSRGARAYPHGPVFGKAPALYGIGDSLIHMVTEDDASFLSDFEDLPEPELVEDMGFLAVDHLTNNVVKGTMETWSNFYKEVFGFTEVRYFDIRGVQTGLTSYALRSPDGSFCIPINEGNETKSQIEEYLREYNGPGVQHLAFTSSDLLTSLERLDSNIIETLDIDDEYYEEVFDRVPGVTEDPERVKRLQVLIDGDDEGYLLQIFTRNIIGPIFIEMIQRKNHQSFGEGNFSALFRSIERDQARRGVL